MEVRLPEEKILRICTILDSFVYRKSCTKRELISLLGHMNFASRVILPGRSFVTPYLQQCVNYTIMSNFHKSVEPTCLCGLSFKKLEWSVFIFEWPYYQRCRSSFIYGRNPYILRRFLLQQMVSREVSCTSKKWIYGFLRIVSNRDGLLVVG